MDPQQVVVELRDGLSLDPVDLRPGLVDFLTAVSQSALLVDAVLDMGHPGLDVL